MKITFEVYFKDYGVFIDNRNSPAKYMSIHPNPSTTYLQINSILSKPANAIIYNFLGEALDSFTIMPGETILNITKFQIGTYYMKVELPDLNQLLTFQFIKQ